MSIMSEADSFSRPLLPLLEEEWAPGERARRWLLAGIWALAIDLGLSLTATALEKAHWGRPGLTPDVILEYIALIPQAIVIAAYLVLAREAGARGLWKSAAGMFASYLLLSLLGLVLLEAVKGRGAGFLVAAAFIGVIGLSFFSLSKFPKFAPPPTPRSGFGGSGNQVTGGYAEREAKNDFGDEKGLAADPPKEQKSEEGGGCLVHLVVGVGLLALKSFARGRKNKWLGNLAIGVDGWTLVVLAILGAFACGYALWFAGAKINCRRRLGGLAAATGYAELLIVLAHVVMVAGLLIVFVDAVADPQFDENKFEQWIDPWLMQASVASTVCHAVWSVVTILFFAVLRARGAPDWREQFLAPAMRS